MRYIFPLKDCTLQLVIGHTILVNYVKLEEDKAVVHTE
jgi:hypothetical protein